MNDTYESRDKQIAPFLLTQKSISLVGTRLESSVVYFQFSPYEKCIELVNLFTSNQAPLVNPKELLDAVETFRDRVFEMKDKRYGKNN